MENKFTKVATFQYSSEAFIVKGRLEAEGIEVFMVDNTTIDTDPLVSNAIGGVKLSVLTEDAQRASEILQSIGRFSVDENGNSIICPECGSATVEVVSTVRDKTSFWSFIVSFLLGALPPYTKYKYRCDACKHEFEIQ